MELDLNHNPISRRGNLQQGEREFAVSCGAQIDVDLEQSVKTLQCEAKPAVVPTIVGLIRKVKGGRLRGVRAAFTVESDDDIALNARGYQLSADRRCSIFSISNIPIPRALCLLRTSDNP